MAGTSDDFSIGEEWPLLCDVRAFVTRYCKTETAAQELLLEFARKGHFKRYRWYAPDAQRQLREGAGIDPRLWGGPAVVVDWDNSCVTYVRPGLRELRLDLYNELRDFLPADPQYRMLLVRLHRDDVLAMLRAVGLPVVEAAAKEVPAVGAAPEEELIPEAPSRGDTGGSSGAGAPGDAPATPSKTHPVSEVPELSPAPPNPTRLEEMERDGSRVITGSMTASEGSDTAEFAGDVDRLAEPKRRRLGKQERRLEALAQEIYGEDLPMLRPSELQQAIERKKKDKTLKTELPPHWAPSLDVCKNFLEKRGKLRPS
jgi:hypothetical protein